MGRVILHSDLNNFYASCECALDTSLREKAVAVCGNQAERHGIVLAKNYLAKSCGVTTGEAVWQAKQKCPDLVVVEPHYQTYVKYSQLVREIYYHYTDRVEPFGMDECWLDVSDPDTDIAKGARIANEIRERVKFETGLTVSVGVSFNKIFAKLGSDLKKPDAVSVISDDNASPDYFQSKIWGLPASDMLGVGRATKRRLDGYGIHTIGDLAHTDLAFFRHNFGKNGEQLWYFANGLDTSEVCPVGGGQGSKSFGHGTTTLYDLTDNDEVWTLMLDLAQNIGHSLRSSALYASGVAIHLRDSELFTRQFQCQLERPTMSAYKIACAAYELFLKSYNWALPLRSVTVTAINLVEESDSPQQLSMLDEDVLCDRRDEKREAIESCVDKLRSRFGDKSVQPATLLKPKCAKMNETKLTMPTGTTTVTKK